MCKREYYVFFNDPVQNYANFIGAHEYYVHRCVYSEIKDAPLVFFFVSYGVHNMEFFVSYGVHNMEIQRVLNLPSSLYTYRSLLDELSL